MSEKMLREERFRVVEEPIDVSAVISWVTGPEMGAIVPFLGMVREWTKGKRTVYLEYDAFVEMARRTLYQIGDEIESRWSGARAAIVHRIGRLEVGDIAVVVAVASPHREDAFEASRYGIERIKQFVPIWKKEHWEDGTAWIGHQSGPS
ncbi:molybdenum cofactor biosynthesis protein MoaE [Kyrpidia tusciae]|uniref:Molybdopterin synthase catalytic subunit n=1 Tax=Kyrpidia tusciae (strain DSM 2912 / NBRC 15312 / T2) TaxID=562970 RepID=D5WSL6_KYRT2|nr:molybdopterin biosynthesis MoaE protein [Kyrpidia tusciae DSM 2912]